jgi:hypothetical protein
MSANTATLVNHTYTPLAFRPETERWLVAVLASLVAVVWCFVIPLEIVLHDPAVPKPHLTAGRAAARPALTTPAALRSIASARRPRR